MRLSKPLKQPEPTLASIPLEGLTTASIPLRERGSSNTVLTPMKAALRGVTVGEAVTAVVAIMEQNRAAVMPGVYLAQAPGQGALPVAVATVAME